MPKGSSWPSGSPRRCKKLSTRLSSLFRRERFEHDLDKELGFHIDMLTEQHVKAGMAPGEARRAAMRAFGAVDRVKDDVRDTWLSRLAHGRRVKRTKVERHDVAVIRVHVSIEGTTEVFIELLEVGRVGRDDRLLGWATSPAAACRVIERWLRELIGPGSDEQCPDHDLRDPPDV